jgi:hypothetical protein
VGVIVNWRETARLDRRALDLVDRELALIKREDDLEKLERHWQARNLSEARRDGREVA